MITVRDARPGDGDALARIHGQMAAYYATLAPSKVSVVKGHTARDKTLRVEGVGDAQLCAALGL